MNITPIGSTGRDNWISFRPLPRTKLINRAIISHVCDYCGELIDKGDPYCLTMTKPDFRVNFWYQRKLHLECESALRATMKRFAVNVPVSIRKYQQSRGKQINARKIVPGEYQA